MKKQTDIIHVFNDFQNSNSPNDRYASFDYCYNYFLTNSGDELLNNMEKSCMSLGFYLASWGMLRGSSFLLQKSARHFQPTIEYIASLDKSVWEIDADNYNEENIQTILKIYSDIKKVLIPNGNQDLTLITKILLGVLGFIPAYDNFFCNAFRDIFNGECGFRRVNQTSLELIGRFYEENKEEIDTLHKQTFTTGFMTGEKTTIRYPKAKIIDMYGFTKGLNAN